MHSGAISSLYRRSCEEAARSTSSSSLIATTRIGGLGSVSRVGSRGTVSQIVRRCEFGGEDGDSDSDDHLSTGRRPMKQAGKLESKSIVRLRPKPTCGVLVDRHLGDADAVDFLLLHSCIDCLDESIAPVISIRCLFDPFRQLVVMLALAIPFSLLGVICENQR
jgi:hypothetical protein